MLSIQIIGVLQRGKKAKILVISPDLVAHGCGAEIFNDGGRPEGGCCGLMIRKRHQRAGRKIGGLVCINILLLLLLFFFLETSRSPLIFVFSNRSSSRLNYRNSCGNLCFENISILENFHFLLYINIYEFL